MEQSQGIFMKPLMVLSVWEGGVSGSLIAMATLDHSLSDAPAHWVSTLVGSRSHRCRDDGGCVRAKEEKGENKVKATHLAECRLYPAVPPL